MKAGVTAALLALLPAAATAQNPVPACLAAIRPAAVRQGIPRALFDSATAGLRIDSSVVRARNTQPEFVTPIWDYLAVLVDDERIEDGRARLADLAPVFASVERRFGVDRHVVAAVWGVESDYGRSTGSRPVLQALVTGACTGRRRTYFRGELIAALRIVAEGHVRGPDLLGSWAGAIGQTQFMPSTVLRLAVDGDGDGRKDLIGSAPDALASAANYLKQRGWTTGEGWGYEVRLPRDFRLATGRRTRRTVAQWAAAGVTRLDGGPLTGEGPSAILLPAGREGPAFLLLPNFDVIYGYNAAESYALAIAHLADRLRGASPFTTPWPTDDRGLSRAERREVQALLFARGFNIVVDGVIGGRTRDAIRAFQAEVGLEPTGRPGGLVLDSLRSRTQPPP